MVVLATAPPQTATGPRLLTAADLAVLPSQLPSGPVLWELDNGRLVVMAPPGRCSWRALNRTWSPS